MKKLLSVLLLLCMLVSLLPVAATAASTEPTEAPAVESGVEGSAGESTEDAGETPPTNDPELGDPPADSAENNADESASTPNDDASYQDDDNTDADGSTAGDAAISTSGEAALPAVLSFGDGAPGDGEPDPGEEPVDTPVAESEVDDVAGESTDDAGETPPIDGSSDPNNAPSDEPEGEAVDSDTFLVTISCDDFGSAAVVINGATAPPVKCGTEVNYQVAAGSQISVVAQPLDGYDQIQTIGNYAQEDPKGTFTFTATTPGDSLHLDFLPSDAVKITYHDNEMVYWNYYPISTPVYLNSEIVDSNAQLMLAGYAVGSEDGPVLPTNSWQVFTENTDLYAKYEKCIKLTFHEMHGDTEWTFNEYVIPNSPTTLADTEIQSIQAWSTEADGSGTRYECGGAYTFDKDTDLYAIRYPEPITVTYYYGENYSLNQWHTQGKGTVVWIPTTTNFDIQGVIKYWAVGSPDSKTVYLPGQEIPMDDDLDLYAVMADETVTITYNSGDERNSTYTKNIAKDCDFLLPTYSGFVEPLDKEFAGWSLEKGGEILDETVKFTEDTTLYAVWGNAILVTFDANGGTSQQYQVLQAVGGRIRVPSAVFNCFKRDGYKLAGWSLSADSNEPFDPDLLLTSNITLYAIWELPKIVIKNEDSGVSVSMTATEEADGLALVASKLPETQEQSAAALIVKNVQGEVEKTYILDIYFVNKETGEKESIDDSRTVTVPIPEGWDAENTAVYYVDPETDTAVDMHGTVSADGKSISFVTTHFSFYALVQTAAVPAAAPTASPAPVTAPKHSPKTGDEALPMLWLALMGVSVLAVGVLLAKKKYFEK